VSALAHVFEAAGIATVVLSSIRPMAEKVSPPRALHCEFPLGRPLGKPGDAEFQHDVLAQAFALLDAPSGPVLVDYPTVIEAVDEPLACALPPRFDANVPPAIDEARGLRKAYDRTLARRGVTSVGRVMSADEVPDMLAKLHEIAGGAAWDEAGLPKNLNGLGHDIRSYYAEAALELATEPLADGRAVEAWFHESTEAGKTLLAARAAMRTQGAPHPMWFYLAPGQR
jgi:hypothetical protein